MLIGRFGAREKSIMLMRDGKVEEEGFEKKRGVPSMHGGVCLSIWKPEVCC